MNHVVAEAAAQAAADLIEIAFRSGWPDIPSGQPEWLLVLGLAQAAAGDVDAGSELAIRLVVDEQGLRYTALLRRLGWSV